MADIVVRYNGTAFSPTPLVNKSYSFIDYGTRWGNIEQIELAGNITGLTGGPASIQSNFALNFTGQFGVLEVLDGSTTIYQWNNIVIDEINFPPNRLGIATSYPYSMAPYTVKMRSINVPSGVLDPVNEYSFNQGDDSLVSVTHKISARGIHGTQGGLANAIAFVRSFTGQNPFSAALGPSFIPTGQGILASLSENIDRATCSYSVQETYKFNTGGAGPYIESWTVDTSDVFDDEWLTLDFNWKIQGSPVYNNVTTIENTYILDPINKLNLIGYATGNFIQDLYHVSRDTGAATIQVRATYVSGYNPFDILGYLDYNVSLNQDLVTPKEDWRIEGSFACFGPRDYRVARLAAFKADQSGQGSWRKLLSGLIVQSPVYQYHSGTHTFGGHSEININENTGLAQFHISMTTSDGSHPNNLYYPKYTLEVEPNKWNYDFLPSANIEGHYVLQDLQMMSQGKININVEGQVRNPSLGLTAVSGAMDSLSNLYLGTGFLTAESYTTGLTDVNATRSYLGLDNMSSGLTYTKVAGSNLTDYLRAPGYKFGY